MTFTWPGFLAAFMVLFAVIDIVGSLPIIVDIKRKSGQINELKASLIALSIMIVFLFLGEKVILFLGTDVNFFAIAGSMVLFFLAFEMILGVELFSQDETEQEIASVVPIAFPLIAGAGSMTTIISLRAEYSQLDISMAIVANMTIVYFVLKSTDRLERWLGPGGVAILRKAFGIVILAIVVKLFSTNLKAIF
jgi:multiple antibiotic resistance protein